MDITRFYESLWDKLDWKIYLWVFRAKDWFIELLEPLTYRADERLCIHLAWRYAMESNQLEDLDKLMDLASILESANDNEWDMGTWYRSDRCGTVGCAAYQYAKARPDSGLKIIDFQPEFRGSCGWAALSSYFSLDGDDTEWIFDDACYVQKPVSRQQVIDRIREFVAQKKRELEAA